MLYSPDPFDPIVWDIPRDEEFRIYGDDRAQTWAVVDEIDYRWAIRYRWAWKPSRSKTGKFYLRRAIGENSNGMRLRTFTEYLHIAIMKRTGIQPQSPAHHIVDHRDGNSQNCRRNNLRWATPRQNAINIHGSHYHDFLL